MKNTLFLFATLLLGMFASCSDGSDDIPAPEEKASITIDSSIITNGLTFEAVGGEKTISFSSNKDWTLSVAATTGGTTWCTASATSWNKGDATVKFTVKENSGYDDRSVSVTIKAEDVSKTFTITQKAVDALLLTSSKFDVSQEGGTIDVEVKANINYQLEVAETAKGWITPTSTRALTTRKHSFAIAASEEYEKREGEIYIKSGNKVETVKVYQAGGAILMLSKNECSVSDKGETITVDIRSNMEYGVQLPEVDWIHDMASTRGASSHTLQYVIDANEGYDSRSAAIIFYDKKSNLKDTLKVIQAQKDAIVLSKTEYNIAVEGGILDFEVSSNVDFTVETSVDWIKQTTSRTLEKKRLFFTVDENTTQAKREGTITFVYNDLKQVVNVIQLGEVPYVTFTAEAAQTLTMSKAVETLEYSVNGSEWKSLDANFVAFGGTLGTLRLRGKSATGTANSNEDYAQILFGNDTPVACSGDIRTLVDYESYDNLDTSIAKFCYLFSGCSNLTTAPNLPATTLANGCYEGMFSHCTNLTAAPELPATTLAPSCYLNMFNSCTSLTTAPELPAITLANGCYEGMFRRCTSLTTAPELPATTLADYCYSGMFSGCTSLTTAPELPATTLEDYCYYTMFYGCISLTTAPELPATTLANSCYDAMFQECTSLTAAPELPATTLAAGCYSFMFFRCSNLTAAPELPATTLANHCYNSMFWDCTGLIVAPELPATTLAGSCYSYMFSGCTSLTTAPELPATTLAENCYFYMFKDCTSLTTAPELRATTLANYCYRSMFSNCASLDKITMLATDISALGCLDNWVSEICYFGTFIKAAEMNTLPKGASGIPSGWTVKNYGE